MNEWTAGDYGGAFAFVVALLGIFGKAADWIAKRTDRRAERLAKWEANLTAREKDYRATIEGELDEIRAEVGQLRTQNAALGVSLLDVTTALRTEDPANPALARAAATLRLAFPVDRALPTGLAELIGRFDEKGGAHGT